MQKASAVAVSLLIFHSLSPQVSAVDTLRPGEKLNSSSFLASAKNLFTLGFCSIGISKYTYLAIWYTGFSQSNCSSVWIANRDRPIHNNSAILTIDGSGKLMIMHDGADPIELYAAESGSNITATLLDTGNFVVKQAYSNGTKGREILWQSFDYPTDTVLPGMKLGVNRKTGRNWTLTSWFSRNNPASGAFTLEWDPMSHRLVVRRRGAMYWTSGDLKFYYKFKNLDVCAFDYIVPKPDTLNLNYLNYIFKNATNQDEDYFAYSLYHDEFTEEYRRTISGWTLSYEGDIGDFDRVSVARVDLCYGYDTRGSEVYLGCELWEQPKCRNKHQNFSYRYGYFEFNTASQSYDDSSALSLSDCRSNCWNNCECVAFDEAEVGCWYWRGKNAIFLQDNAQMSYKRYFLISEHLKKTSKRKVIVISAPTVAVLLVILGSLLFLGLKIKQGKRRKEKELQELMTLEDCTGTSEFENNGGRGNDLVQFSYASILESTNSFSSDNKLGEGGFGPVYKGKMPQGREIAVKLLSQRSGQGLVEFKTEVVLMSKLQHRNLVKLLGFCIHGNEKIIIYDYVPNKSLDFFLFDPAKRGQLNWGSRFNIIEGIAQGLLYLHKYSRLLIIHRDLKASNILLDENMNPKIADFGLARIVKQNVPEANTTKPAGTRGYMAPEYVEKGIFSVKSDIYSFGVLILEIVSGRRNNSFRNPEGPLNLVEFAWNLWKQCAELELIDSTLKSSCTKDQARRCTQVGLLCVQNRASDRPSIEDAMSMLKTETKDPPMPRRPAFVARDNVVRKLKPGKSSLNEMSLTAMDGR